MIEDPISYRVDGEIGRIKFQCHHVVRDGVVVLDTSREVFPALTGQEWYQTVGFKDLAIVHGARCGSYRRTTDTLNRVRHQPKATPLRTVRDRVEAEGRAVAEALDREARSVLRDSGINDQTLLPVEPQSTCTPKHLDPQRVEHVLREIAGGDEQLLAAMRANPVKYEDPHTAVNVSIDEDVAKKQKEHREPPGRTTARSSASQVSATSATEDASKDGDPPVAVAASVNDEVAKRPKDHRNLPGRTAGQPLESQASKSSATEAEKKRVHATVAHVQMGDNQRVFASAGLLSTCLLVAAMIVANKKLLWTWMFFVDGQKTLRDTILQVFAWQGTLQLILDWFHLVKKCKESLSSALNNRHVRNAELKPLLRLLWYGNVDGALRALHQIDAKHVKNQEALDRLIGYLERNRPYIPCYVARKRLGLRNSSNRGEKSNDIVMSARQKHKGMSWSQSGSSALATLSALVANDNHRTWFEERTVDFRLAA